MAKTICEKCGAEFDDMLPECPYCGFISYPGAEEKYLGDLEELHDDLKDVVQIPKEEYKKELSKTTKKILLGAGIALTVIALVGLIYGATQLIRAWYFRSSYNIKDEIIWEQKNFPIIDEMYANGQYDEILAFEEHAGEGTHHSLQNWEHVAFIRTYQKYKEELKLVGYLDSGSPLYKYEWQYLVEKAIWFYGDFFINEKNVYGKDDYSDKEYKLILTYQKEINDILFNRLKFTKEEADKLVEECMKEGNYRPNPSLEYADKVHERFE